MLHGLGRVERAEIMYTRFYTKTPIERRKILETDGVLNLKELAGNLNEETAMLDRMSENVIGSWRLPLGVVPQLLVNGKKHRVAMATEEASVVAAVNRVAKVLNASGGVECDFDVPVTMAQITGTIPLAKANAFKYSFNQNKSRLIELANAQNPKMIALGGGAFDIQIDILPPEWNETWRETFIILKLYVHTLEAMGANAVNTMAEALMHDIANECEEFIPCMAILSNDGEGRMVHAHVKIPFHVLEEMTCLSGEDFARRITRASALADRCPERAVTHNKGIMNGIIAASLPLGQDTRAISASFYDCACQSGQHCPMVRWQTVNEFLYGESNLPLPVGFVGGFRKNTAVNAAFAFDKIESYQELCSFLAAVGIAQNLGALWALTTEGIQAGHMKLHLRKE